MIPLNDMGSVYDIGYANNETLKNRNNVKEFQIKLYILNDNIDLSNICNKHLENLKNHFENLDFKISIKEEK